MSWVFRKARKSRNGFLPFLLTVGLLFAMAISPGVAMADGGPINPINYNAWKDNYIVENAPTSNYGTDYYMFLSDRSNQTRRVLISFELTDTPSIFTHYVASAVLELYVDDWYDTDPVGKDIWAHRLTRPFWHETQSNWNRSSVGNDWTTPGGDYDTTHGVTSTVPSDSKDKWMEWHVTDLVQAAFESQGDAHFLLMFDEEDQVAGYSKILFRTKDHPWGPRPKLIVTFAEILEPSIWIEELERDWEELLYRVHFELDEEPEANIQLWWRAGGVGGWTTSDLQNVTEDGYLDIPAIDLDRGTMYEVRGFIEWAGGSNFSPPLLGYTLDPPDISVSVESVTTTTAQIRMDWILNDANQMDLWLGYREQGAGPWDYASPVFAVSAPSGYHIFSIDGLTPDTTYEYRGEVDYPDPHLYTDYTAVHVFSTPLLDDEPSITATSITHPSEYDRQPRFGAHVLLGEDDGMFYMLRFEYRRTDPLGDWMILPAQAVTADGWHHYQVSTAPFLLYGEDYEFRARLAYNSETTYSLNHEFTIPVEPASVVIHPAIGITDSSALIRAMVDIGGYDTIQVWFYYYEVGEEGEWINLGLVTASGPVQYELTALKGGTEYVYYCAVQYWDVYTYTVYSEQETFKTDMTTAGWLERILTRFGINDPAGRIIFSLIFIVGIPALLYFILGGLFIPLVAATGALAFFSAIGWVPLWLIILLVLILLMGYYRLVKGGNHAEA